jgi:hypothetical protein
VLQLSPPSEGAKIRDKEKNSSAMQEEEKKGKEIKRKWNIKLL